MSPPRAPAVGKKPTKPVGKARYRPPITIQCAALLIRAGAEADQGAQTEEKSYRGRDLACGRRSGRRAACPGPRAASGYLSSASPLRGFACDAALRTRRLCPSRGSCGCADHDDDEDVCSSRADSIRGAGNTAPIFICGDGWLRQLTAPQDASLPCREGGVRGATAANVRKS